MKMPETPLSLLDRLRLQPDDASWRRLLELYTPLIQGWLRRQQVLADDADDLVQEVLGVVARELPNFQRQRTGSFRRWLRLITAHRLRGFWRAQRLRPRTSGDSNFENILDQLADPASDLGRLWDQEHDRHVARRLLQVMEPEFTPSTWQAFRLQVLEEVPAAEAAARLGLTVNAVLLAKSRVLRRLRQEGQGLLD